MSNLNNNYLLKKVNKNTHKESINIINNSSDEIIKLERQFRNAYMLKSLEAQIAEKEANKIAQSVKDKLQIDLIAYENRKAIENEFKKTSQVKKERRECVNYLRKQIMLREEIAAAEEEYLREERKILGEVDEIVELMHEIKKNNKREYLARKLKREKQIDEEIKEISRVNQLEEEMRALERDIIYQEKLKLREEEWRITRQDKINAREEWIGKVCKLIEEEIINRREADEREKIIFELVAEDIKYQLIVKENENLLLMRENKVKLGRDLLAQMLETVELEDRAVKRENLLAEQIIRRVMKEDYLSRLTDQARKRKHRQYKEDLAKFIEEARIIRKEIVLRARTEFESEAQIQRELTAARIEDQRKRLIDLHAKNVTAYLRNGILFNEISKEENK